MLYKFDIHQCEFWQIINIILTAVFESSTAIFISKIYV